MPGGRNGSQKWGGHQPNGRSRREDFWGDGGAYGFRGGRGTPRERAAAAIDTPRHGDSKTFGWENIDSNMDGFTATCSVLGKVRKVTLSDCGLGPSSCAELSKVFRDADAAVEDLDLSGCGLTGATKDAWGKWENIDSDMDGFIALCSVLGKVRTVRLSDCGLGPGSTVADLANVSKS